METFVEDVLQLMAENRKEYPKDWEKVRLDRIHKLLPSSVDVEEFIQVFLQDTRIKQVEKKDKKKAVMVPAVQLHFTEFTKRTK